MSSFSISSSVVYTYLQHMCVYSLAPLLNGVFCSPEVLKFDRFYEKFLLWSLISAFCLKNFCLPQGHEG